MKVKTSQELNLKGLKTPYQIDFKSTKKNGVDDDFWFTDGGKCKIWFGSLIIDFVGKISESTEDRLRKLIIDNKSDILTNQEGNRYYTLTTDGLSEIRKFHTLKENIKEYYRANEYRF
jgi:hypothetical protein